MPSVSQKQQEAMAIALHNPSKLKPANKGLTKMSKGSLRDFASTPHDNLPKMKSSGLGKMRDSDKDGM